MGKSGCDSCLALVDELPTGRLQRADFERLTVFAAKLDNPKVLPELWDAWRDPDQLATIQAKHAAETTRIATMLVTSGFEFQGRRITSYLGFVSRQVVFGMGMFRGITSDFADLAGSESVSLGNKLDQATTVAFDRLKRAVHQMGGNAVIGADLDYTMFGTSLVGAIASGTAVVLDSAD